MPCIGETEEEPQIHGAKPNSADRSGSALCFMSRLDFGTLPSGPSQGCGVRMDGRWSHHTPTQSHMQPLDYVFPASHLHPFCPASQPRYSPKNGIGRPVRSPNPVFLCIVRTRLARKNPPSDLRRTVLRHILAHLKTGRMAGQIAGRRHYCTCAAGVVDRGDVCPPQPASRAVGLPCPSNGQNRPQMARI